MSGLRDVAREDAGGARRRLPELRRGAGGQARDDAVHRLPPVPASSTSRKGVGGELAHYAQDNAQRAADPARQHRHAGARRAASRCRGRWSATSSAARSPSDDEDEQAFWREYLLYHRSEGFAFLVDAEDGWSWTRADHRRAAAGRRRRHATRARPTASSTATPARSPTCSASSTGSCSATSAPSTPTTTAPAATARKRLNRERTGSGETQEIVWSAGETLDADDVLTRVPPRRRPAARRCSATRRRPRASASRCQGLHRDRVVVVVVLMVIAAAAAASAPTATSVRSTFGEASHRIPQLPASSGSGGAHQRRLVRRLFQRRRPQVAARRSHSPGASHHDGHRMAETRPSSSARSCTR